MLVVLTMGSDLLVGLVPRSRRVFPHLTGPYIMRDGHHAASAGAETRAEGPERGATKWSPIRLPIGPLRYDSCRAIAARRCREAVRCRESPRRRPGRVRGR